MIIRESQLPVCRCELTLPPRIFSVPTIISTCIFVLRPFFTLPPTASSILRPGPFTLVTYPSPLTDTDRYQILVVVSGYPES